MGKQNSERQIKHLRVKVETEQKEMCKMDTLQLRNTHTLSLSFFLSVPLYFLNNFVLTTTITTSKQFQAFLK